MASKVFSLNKAADYAAAIEGVENFAAPEGLDARKALHLRLLAEELIGKIGNIVQVHNGSLSAENSEGSYTLRLKANAPIDRTAKSALLKAAPQGKNSAYSGVKGKILLALDFMSGETAVNQLPLGVFIPEGGEAQFAYDYEWSLSLYRKQAEQDKKIEAWDELELSILSKLTDDIRVGVRSNCVDITLIVK